MSSNMKRWIEIDSISVSDPPKLFQLSRSKLVVRLWQQQFTHPQHYKIQQINMYCWGNFSPFPLPYPMAGHQIGLGCGEQGGERDKKEREALLERVQHLQKENQQLKVEIDLLKSRKVHRPKRRIKRRQENQLRKNLKCLFPKCKKEYASSLALNLHMKLKHNAGTKRGREHLAKQIIQAQNNDTKLPPIDITFPPNYLEVAIVLWQEFRKKYVFSDQGEHPHHSTSSFKIEHCSQQ